MFARGFKTWCETCAMLQRRRLHLQPIDPLDPRHLAKLLGVRIRTAAEVPGLDAQVVATLKRDSGSWAAVTISDGVNHVIITNPWHITEDGSLILNTYDRGQEDEANWLAGCLLLPRDALLHIRATWSDLSSAATHYGVSMDLLTYRMNITGDENQFRRGRRRSARFG
jgi:hypothetical protein